MPESPQRVSNTEVGEIGPTDWRGMPIRVGSTVVYPCEAYGHSAGRSTQMAEGTVVALRENGATIEVDRRSRTGKPDDKYGRTRVRLTAVGLANVTVLGYYGVLA